MNNRPLANDNSDVLVDSKPIDMMDRYVNSALTIQPSTSTSMASAFDSAVLSSVALGSDIASQVNGKRSDYNIKINQLKDSVDLIRQNVNSIPQEGMDFIANTFGAAFTVAPIGLEGLAGKGIQLISPAIATKLPTLAAKTIPKLGLKGIGEETVGKAAQSAAETGARVAAFTAPQELQESYNQETNKFNLGKAAIGITANGALGAAIPAAPYFMGLVGSKINRAVELIRGNGGLKDAIDLEGNAGKIQQADIALKHAAITPDEHKLYVDLLTDPKQPGINDRATAAVLKLGHPADHSTDSVFVKLMDEEDSKNVEALSIDQLASDLPEGERTAATDFIIQNKLDRMRKDPAIADGLDGWIKHIDELLAKKDEALAKVEIANPELKALYDSVHKNNKLMKNFKNKNAYQKLQELSLTSKDAVNVLDKIHLEDAHNAQLSYRNIMGAYRDILRSNIKKLANPQKVVDYLNSKLEAKIQRGVEDSLIKKSNQFGKTPSENMATDNIPQMHDEEFVTAPETVPNSKPSDKASSISEPKKASLIEDEFKQQDAIIEELPESGSTKDYTASKRKFNQFQKGKKALKNLISCVLGSQNGKV